MTTITDIIESAVTQILENHADDYNFEFSASCRDFGKDAAVHVADALETAGYGMVAGEKEWGVRLSDGSVEEVHDQSAAELVCLDWPSTEAVVSRTVTAWKKEA